MRRKKMSRRYSKKYFRQGAKRVHNRNIATPMRGGWRL
jgi:hypothetical protein